MNSRQVTPDILGDVLAAEPAAVRPTKLSLQIINRSGGTQPRAALDERYIADLVEVLTNGGSLPPVDVTYDGVQYWLHDGFHRWEAHCQAERNEIDAVVHQGDLQAAQWQSYAANQAHGLRRTREDRERAIRAALKHPAGQVMSNREIAKHLGVDDKTIGKYREEMERAAQIPQVRERTGGDGKTYTQPETNYAEVWRLESHVRDAHKIEHGMFDRKTGCELLRRTAKERSGDLWRMSDKRIRAAGLTYRTLDLVQAMNNVAYQEEAKIAQPEQRPISKLDIDAVNLKIADQRSVAASVHKVGSEAESASVQQLADNIYDYLRKHFHRFELSYAFLHKHTDDARACFHQSLRARGLVFQESDLNSAIDRVVTEIDAMVLVEPEHSTPEPEPETVSLADLPVVATTGPVVFVAAPDSPPLPDWVVDEPEPEAAPGQIVDIAERVLKLKTWRAGFSITLKNIDSWAEATGHFTATLDAERGLRRMVEMTDNELAALAA